MKTKRELLSPLEGKEALFKGVFDGRKHKAGRMHYCLKSVILLDTEELVTDHIWVDSKHSPKATGSFGMARVGDEITFIGKVYKYPRFKENMHTVWTVDSDFSLEPISDYGIQFIRLEKIPTKKSAKETVSKL